MVEDQRINSNLMDIVTHAGIGLIAAAPFLNSRPELALGLVAGSVLPDLDALTRVLGKRAFLSAHQTWSHALPVQFVISTLAGCCLAACGLDGLLFGIGLMLGFAGHTLLDLSNTLGVTLFAPFSRKRFCLEWVFFIDAFVLSVTTIAASRVLRALFQQSEVTIRSTSVFLSVIVVYVFAKGWLRWRARLLAPEAESLLPSALWPWRFLGASKGDNSIRLFHINAITGRQETLTNQAVLDSVYATVFENIPEFKLMRQLSPAYHVVTVQPAKGGELVTCRDLRTRNFGTRFGDLEILLNTNHEVIRKEFHV